MGAPRSSIEYDESVVRVDYASSTINYYGYTYPGSSALTSSAIWKIKRETLDTSSRTILIDWADGNHASDNVWDNRATLSYS